MEKFVVRRIKVSKNEPMLTFNVHAQAYEKLKAVAKESGQSLVTLFDMMVDYCLEHLEIR